MKIKELIEILKEYDENLYVAVPESPVAIFEVCHGTFELGEDNMYNAETHKYIKVKTLRIG